MITITAVLLNWKRPENIVKTIKSIRDQSISVKICLWNNNSDDKIKYDVDLQINSPDNFKCSSFYYINFNIYIFWLCYMF
jgi:hypothetical protein